MTLGLALMAVLDAASLLIATLTILTVGFLVGVRQEAAIDGDDPNCLDWLGKSLRPFVLRLSELLCSVPLLLMWPR